MHFNCGSGLARESGGTFNKTLCTLHPSNAHKKGRFFTKAACPK